MPLYTYRAYTSDGRCVRGRDQAASIGVLQSLVRRAGLHLRVDSVRQRHRWRCDPRRLKLSLSEAIDLFQHLELQLGAGVLTEEAIASMMQHETRRRTRYVLSEVHQAITNGRMSISEAFGLFPRSFPPSLLTVIRAGEKAGAGELGRRFGDLRGRLEFYRQVRGVTFRAFQYPALIALLAAAFVVFVFTFLVPVLARVLDTVNVPLPPVTAALVALSEFIADHGWVLAGASGGLPLFWWSAHRWKVVALALDRLLLRLPYAGAIYRSIACSIVFRTYASLYDAGEPAPEILDLCAGLLRNRAMRAGVETVRRRVLRGDPLHVAFQRSGCFPADACAMVKTGETAGLGESMRLSAEHHAALARERIAFAVSWLEPAAIIAMGAFVGVIAYAFFSPIMAIYESIR